MILLKLDPTVHYTILGVFVIFGAVLVFFVIRGMLKKTPEFDKKGWHEALSNFAQKWGLTYDGNPTQFNRFENLSGKIQDHDFGIKVTEHQHEDEDGHVTYSYHTVFKVKAIEHKVNFEIKTENFFDRIAQKLGKDDIEFDRDDLDKKFKFKSDYEAEFRKYFNVDLQDKLIAIQPLIRGLIAHHMNYIEYSFGFKITNTKELADFDVVLEFLMMLSRTEIKNTSY
jgi:hypothetical protein